MAANLKSRIARLESVSGGEEPLIIIIVIFGEPETAFTGFQIDGEFVAPIEGESMQETEARVIAELEDRRDGRHHIVIPIYAPGFDLVEEVTK